MLQLRWTNNFQIESKLSLIFHSLQGDRRQPYVVEQKYLPF